MGGDGGSDGGGDWAQEADREDRELGQSLRQDETFQQANSTLGQALGETRSDQMIANDVAVTKALEAGDNTFINAAGERQSVQSYERDFSPPVEGSPLDFGKSISLGPASLLGTIVGAPIGLGTVVDTILGSPSLLEVRGDASGRGTITSPALNVVNSRERSGPSLTPDMFINENPNSTPQNSSRSVGPPISLDPRDYQPASPPTPAPTPTTPSPSDNMDNGGNEPPVPLNPRRASLLSTPPSTMVDEIIDDPLARARGILRAQNSLLSSGSRGFV